MNKRIAIDAMGGDGGVGLTVPASLQALQQIPDLSLVLVGDESQIQSHLTDGAEVAQRYSILHTDQLVADTDKPGNILRSGKQSSMYLAADLVRQGEVQAMVSAGNTGALLMAGRHLLKTISGIQKPAMVATIPVGPNQSYLLDVGANLDCSAQQLFEFAVMGTVLAESLSGETASVGLLNIGAEHHKGTDQVREAAALLERCAALDYVGFIEANELFEGKADVVVCDGFVGNVTIKSSAGAANVVKKLLAGLIQKSGLEESADLSSDPILGTLAAQINPQRFNGASLLGLQGSIIKSHGNATVEGFAYAIRQAVLEVEKSVPQLIAKKVAAIIEASG